MKRTLTVAALAGATVLLASLGIMQSMDSPIEFAAGEETKGKANPGEAEIREFVQRYFKTWSDQDMKGYGECFAPGSVVQFIDPTGRIVSIDKENFVQSQEGYHKESSVRAIEVPVTIDIRSEAMLARAVVYWKLTAGARNEVGYDHFTLIKHPEGWKIVNLVFYKTR